MDRHFYFVANSFEGCGHRHRLKKAGERCRRDLNRRGFKGRLYIMFPHALKASPASVTTNRAPGNWHTDRTWQRRTR